MRKAPNFNASNKDIKRFLLRRENMGILEQKLAQDQLDLAVMSKEVPYGREDFLDRRLSNGEASEVISEVKDAVDSFLGISSLEFPRYTFSNLGKNAILASALTISASEAAMSLLCLGGEPNYFLSAVSGGIAAATLGATAYGAKRLSRPNYSSGKINFTRRDQKRFVTDVAHEYDHHAMCRLSPAISRFRLGKGALLEGHAMGLERNICKYFSRAHQTPEYLHKLVADYSPFLESTLKWIRENDDRKLGSFRTPSIFSLGYAFFSILEHNHGPDVYRQALQGNLKYC